MVELVLPKPASVVNGVVSARAGPLSTSKLSCAILMRLGDLLPFVRRCRSVYI